MGAFLSGGVDSSLVVALMQKQSTQPIRTFSIGFGDERYNEAPFARAVAKHLNTDHIELQVTSAEALDVIPNLQNICDEPFGDSSAIPTFLVCKLARRDVTVALSGDGGDELFGGYDRYSLLNKLMPLVGKFPAPISAGLSKIANYLPLSQADRVQAALRKRGLFPFDLHNPGEKMRTVLRLLSSRSPEDLYYKAIRHWRDSSSVIRGVSGVRGSQAELDVRHVMQNSDHRAFMALVDTILYLPDDILTKVDRASMASSLEARVPLLDHRVVEYATRIPTSIKYKDKRGKWPLRRILAKYIPSELIDRPKKGFSIPLDDWLRGPLRDWAEDLLSEKALSESGYLNTSPIRQEWASHLQGQRDRSQLIWNVLMFQAWNQSNQGTQQ